MIKTKALLYGKNGKAQVGIKFKATKGQQVEVFTKPTIMFAGDVQAKIDLVT